MLSVYFRMVTFHPRAKGTQDFLQSSPWHPCGASGGKTQNSSKSGVPQGCAPELLSCKLVGIRVSVTHLTLEFSCLAGCSHGFCFQEAVILCIHLSLQFSGCQLTLWPQYSGKTKTSFNFSFARLFSCCKDGTDNLQAFYMLDWKLEVISLPIWDTSFAFHLPRFPK